MNISWSSLIEFSSLMMSAWRASISASVCFACCVSMIICEKRVSIQHHVFDPCRNEETKRLPPAWTPPDFPVPAFPPVPRWWSSYRLKVETDGRLNSNIRRNMRSITCSYTIYRYKQWSSLTDFQLSLYPSLTPFSVIGLRSIVLRHHFDELPRKRRMLCLAYPQIRRRFVRVLFLLDILFYHCPHGKHNIKTESASGHSPNHIYNMPVFSKRDYFLFIASRGARGFHHKYLRVQSVRENLHARSFKPKNDVGASRDKSHAYLCWHYKYTPKSGQDMIKNQAFDRLFATHGRFNYGHRTYIVIDILLK